MSAASSPVYKLLTGDANLRGAQESLKLIDPSRTNSFSTAGFMKLRMHLDHIFGNKVEFTDMQDTRAFGDGTSPFHGLSDHVPLITRVDL